MQLKLNLFQSQMPCFNEIYMYYYSSKQIISTKCEFYEGMSDWCPVRIWISLNADYQQG